MTPRSSCPGGESTPLQGANLRLNYEINNVTDTALGNLARGTPSFWSRPQLQTAWVTFGRQRRVNSGARRRSTDWAGLPRQEAAAAPVGLRPWTGLISGPRQWS